MFMHFHVVKHLVYPYILSLLSTYVYELALGY